MRRPKKNEHFAYEGGLSEYGHERLNGMSLPVQALARVHGGRLVEFPRGAEFSDDAAALEPEQLESEERDRRFAEMAERQARFMFRVAHGVLRSRQDAEDAVQEALLKLYRTESWLRIEEEKAFLARTVYRTALDVVARRHGAEQMDAEVERELVWDGSSPEQNVLEGDDRGLLLRLIEGLQEEFRRALVLSAIEEMTSREVAAAIGIPEGTVRTRVMRARAELKRRFEAMRVGRGERR
jgi:RNA polymerase sigma-70 factor, ECF subfamily